MATNHSEVPSEATERVGTLLKDKYRLDSVLGVGGMAIVYAATHRNQRRFAVKILRAELAIRAEIRNRFVREGYIANTVGHPGAVAVLDDDVGTDGSAFLVMELLEGAALEEIWERHDRRITVRSALVVGYQLLDVLGAAHAKAIVHRDIKPANLFVTREGTLKVLDFGIARLRDAASEQATQSGTSIGTPAFMPPEQVLGKSGQIDALTDIWAVGATLFTLISGQLVHEGETPQELMIRSATTPARSLQTVARNVPPAVVRVVDRAVAFERGNRWPTASAMQEAIADVYRETFGEAISSAPLSSLLDHARAAEAPPAAGAGPTVLSDVPVNRIPPGGLAPTVDASDMQPLRQVDQDLTPRALAPPPRLGMTTSQPVSNDLPPAPAASASVERAAAPPKRHARVGVVLGTVAAVMALSAAVLVAGRGWRPTDAPAQAQRLAAASETTTLPPPLLPVPGASITAAPLAGASASAVLAAAAPPALSAVSAQRTRPSVSALAPRATDSSSRPAKPIVNCDTPFVIDSSGHKAWKPECL